MNKASKQTKPKPAPAMSKKHKALVKKHLKRMHKLLTGEIKHHEKQIAMHQKKFGSRLRKRNKIKNGDYEAHEAQLVIRLRKKSLKNSK